MILNAMQYTGMEQLAQLM